jgi:hypothetical protein
MFTLQVEWQQEAAVVWWCSIALAAEGGQLDDGAIHDLGDDFDHFDFFDVLCGVCQLSPIR